VRTDDRGGDEGEVRHEHAAHEQAGALIEAGARQPTGRQRDGARQPGEEGVVLLLPVRVLCAAQDLPRDLDVVRAVPLRREAAAELGQRA
jgi:hypothetical protein